MIINYQLSSGEGLCSLHYTRHYATGTRRRPTLHSPSDGVHRNYYKSTHRIKKPKNPTQNKTHTKGKQEIEKNRNLYDVLSHCNPISLFFYPTGSRFGLQCITRAVLTSVCSSEANSKPCPELLSNKNWCKTKPEFGLYSLQNE